MSAKTVLKTTDYYLNLDYAVSSRRLTEAEGGGYVATIPQLGSRTFVAIGETREEALNDLEDLRQYLIPILVSEGAVLPEPQEEADDASHSGSLMLRLPRLLHAQLAAQAKKNGCSINKLATQYLTQGVTASVTLDSVRQAVREVFAEETHKEQIGSSVESVFNTSSHPVWRMSEPERGDLSPRITDYLNRDEELEKVA